MIDRPIFIIGSGRCGSSVFYRMLATHPSVAYLTGANVRFAERPAMWRMNTLFGRVALQLGLVHPAEAYKLLNSIMPGFGAPTRTLRGSDVTASVRKGMTALVKANLKVQRGKRFLYKYTGWSRIGFMSAIFPDALFIHVVRDGRAVAYSMLTVPWWHGWQGPWNWRWGMLDQQDAADWEKSGRSFAVLAGIEWKMIMNEIESSREEVPPSRFLEVRYEDFVAQPHDVLREVCEFCGLAYSKAFRRRIGRVHLRSANHKWKTELADSEKELLQRCIEPQLERFDYL